MAGPDGRMTTNLTSLLSPRSVALIGASPDRAKIRGALLHILRKNGFAGRIVPINPTYPEIDGLTCYPSIAAVGENIDVALVAIPAAAVPRALEDCAAAGVRNAVVISSGFAEDGTAPADLQDRIGALARRTGMRILGPNAEGFHNEMARVSATFSPAVDRDTDDNPTALEARIGIVAQSGGMGFALYNRGRAMGLSFSAIVSTGNEADLTVADILAHMATDPETKGVLLFLETVRDPGAFTTAAEAATAAGKFIVAIKIGRSSTGKLAAASHTASMAGWDIGYDAMFRRYGILVATELDEALTIAAALASNPPARGGRLAVVTLSGGSGAWAADLLEAAGLELPELDATTQKAIRAFIPSYGSARNPVDLTAGGAQGAGMLRAVELLTRDPGIDQVAVVTTLANRERVAIDVPALAELLAKRRKPVLFYSYTQPSPLGRKALADAGAVICPSMAALAAAASKLMARGRFKPAATVATGVSAKPLGADMSACTGPLAEHQAKAMLATWGVSVPLSCLVRHASGLADAAASLGFPLAAKIQSPGIPHKTEVRGVKLGIADLPELETAFATLTANAARLAPSVAIDGVLLERMAAEGVEMIVGVTRDPTFGPVLIVGAGGVATELFKDTAYRLAPISEVEALEMVRELRSYPLLERFRGAEPADLTAFARLVAQVSYITVAESTIAEMELNPVIVHLAGKGYTIADTLLVLRPVSVRAA
jgi:acetate---CoA ligase (ADP-forming)